MIDNYVIHSFQVILYTHQGLTSGMKCRLVNIHKSNIYCTITTNYIDNWKACWKSYLKKDRILNKGIASLFLLDPKMCMCVCLHHYKYTYIYKLNTTMYDLHKVSWTLSEKTGSLYRIVSDKKILRMAKSKRSIVFFHPFLLLCGT